MPLILLPGQYEPPAAPVTVFELTEAVSGRVGNFLELAQMVTGRVPERELVLDTCVSGVCRP